MLRGRDVALGISSNLAKPYRAAVEQLFPSMNNQAFSFEIGAAKPDPRITRPHWRDLIPSQEGLPEQMHLNFGL
ncbi:hypothetical protein C7U57_24345 [Pseudomonas sp. R9.37]|nr:hypothetical protein C7U57_24345 [Pseudomonas sp. R9.37]